MQEIVGGLIQPVYLFDDPVVLVCNDEGKVMNLSANRGLRDKDGQIYDIVFGAFFLCGAPEDSDHFTSLTPEQTEKYRKLFYTPEMFWGMDGRIVCIPMEVDRDMKTDNPFCGKIIAVTGKLDNYTRDGIQARLRELGARPVSARVSYCP